MSFELFTQPVETNWTDFKNIVKQAMDKFIPQKQVQSSNHIPWLNRQIKLKIKQRKKLHNIARSSAWESYHTKQLKKSEELIAIINANYLIMNPTTPLKYFGNILRV